MDISFKCDNNIIFNYRVAAIIKNKDKILVTTRNNSDYVTLIGGRVNLNEDSKTAIVREIKEETTYNAKYIRTLGIVENFFHSKKYNQTYHEMLFIHEVEFIDNNPYNKDQINNLEEENAAFSWLTLEELATKEFYPKEVLPHLNDKEIFHLIIKQ